jgi:hypothetical protein
MCSPCCARATRGQAVAEPTIPLMKSRRRIAAPRLRTTPIASTITAGIYDRRNGVRSLFCVATILKTQCPLWVRSRHQRMSVSCPLFPRKRTLIDGVGESALCQKQTSARLVSQHRMSYGS